MLTTEEFKTFIDENYWTFAKTYAEWAPHEYVVKDKLDEKNQALIPEVVTLLGDGR